MNWWDVPVTEQDNDNNWNQATARLNNEVLPLKVALVGERYGSKDVRLTIGENEHFLSIDSTWALVYALREAADILSMRIDKED